MPDQQPKRRIADDERHVHFITFSCYHRRQLLELDHPKRIIIGHLGSCLHERNGLCTGFVIMPDHVHALIWFPNLGELSGFMNELKSLSSKAIGRWYVNNRPDYWNTFDDHRVWQTKYYSFNVFSRKKLQEKLDYMHLNPVRAGLVEHPLDWRWSSAEWYRKPQTSRPLNQLATRHGNLSRPAGDFERRVAQVTDLGRGVTRSFHCWHFHEPASKLATSGRDPRQSQLAPPANDPPRNKPPFNGPPSFTFVATGTRHDHTRTRLS